MKEIIFKIDADGEISMEVQGAQGNNCEDFTAPFEESLGVVASRELKASFFESATKNELNEEAS